MKNISIYSVLLFALFGCDETEDSFARSPPIFYPTSGTHTEETSSNDGINFCDMYLSADAFILGTVNKALHDPSQTCDTESENRLPP